LTDVDRVIHEPARLRIMTILSGARIADFTFLLNVLGLTKGNLSSHMDKLQAAGYVDVEKSFQGKVPHTGYRLTPSGKKALAQYWKALDEIRGANGGSRRSS
jgi:DNA-binding MarR family transcriptional regulator